MRLSWLAALVLLLLLVGGAAALSFAAERYQEYAGDDLITDDLRTVQPAEVALVLGTGPRMRDGSANLYLLARLEAAAALWKAGKARYLLVSGNAMGPQDEPAAMRQGLIERGVPASAIYRDPAGFRTWDSVVRARDVFGQRRLLIVSQRSHVARAIYLARSLGMEAFGFEAEDDMPIHWLTRLRQYPAAVLSYYDAWRGELPPLPDRPVAIGRDAPD